MLKEYKVGDILENSIRQFAKVISIKNGIYGLSGWTSKENAEKATVAYKYVNGYGLSYAGVKLISSGSSKKTEAPSVKASSKTTTTKESKPKAKATGGKSTKKSAKASK